MDPQELQPLLESIGLNHHESSVYLSLLQRGHQPASVIARESRAPRSTIRSILDALCRRGIVEKIYYGNTQHYACLPPEAIARSVEEDITEQKRTLKRIHEAIPMLRAFQGSQTLLPKVRYFEGEKGIIEAFHHSLFSGAEEILFLTSYDFFQSRRVRAYDVEEYLPTRIKRSIHMRVLGARTKEAELWAKRAKKELREHRFLEPKYNFEGNFFIYGDFVLYFSSNAGEYIAVLSESAVMAKTMRALFECLWQEAAMKK